MQINEQLLRVKQKTVQLYRTYERWIIALSKLIGMCLILTWINQTVGSIALLTKFYVVIGIGVLAMMLPSRYMIFLMMAIVTAHLVKLNLIMGGICALICLATYIFVIRLYPKESILIIVMMLAYHFKVELAVPMIIALCGTLSGLIPVVSGIVLVNIGTLGVSALKSGTLTNDPVQVIEYVLTTLSKNIIGNSMFFTSVIVAIVVYFTVYIIKKQAMDYAPYIAICVGGVMNLLGFLCAIIFLEVEVNVGAVLGVTLFGVVVCVLIQYFSWPADYGRAEVVQFEDESNYYYVKVVPKILPASTKGPVEQVYTDTQNEIEAQ